MGLLETSNNDGDAGCCFLKGSWGLGSAKSSVCTDDLIPRTISEVGTVTILVFIGGN